MKRLILVIVTLVVSLNFLTSCFFDSRLTLSGYKITRGSESGYKRFMWENDIARFSFEYKSNFRIDKYNTYIFKTDNITQNSCEVKLIGKNDTRISISIFPRNEFPDIFNDAQSRVDYILERWNRFGDVEILESSNVTVSGIQGILLVDKDTDIARALGGMYKNKKEPGPPKCVCREVNLDYNGQIWLISIDSMSSVAEADKEDFNRLLGSFTILE